MKLHDYLLSLQKKDNLTIYPELDLFTGSEGYICCTTIRYLQQEVSIKQINKAGTLFTASIQPYPFLAHIKCYGAESFAARLQIAIYLIAECDEWEDKKKRIQGTVRNIYIS